MRWIVFVFLIVSAGCGRSPSTAPMTIGHVATLTGLDKRAGEQASFGLRLALDEVNKNESLNPFQVRHADAQGQLDAFEAQAVRLISVQRCWGLIGGTTTAEVLRIDKSKLSIEGTAIPLPILALTGYRTPAMSEQVFLTGMSPEFQGQVMGRFAIEEQRVRKAAIFVEEKNEEAAVRAEEFLKGWTESWAKKYAKEPVERPRVVKFASPLKIGELQDEVVVVAGSKKDFLSIAWPEPRPMICFLGDESELQPGDLGAKDVVFVASAFAIEPENKDFVAKFQAAFKQDPDPAAAIAFDDLRILAQALREGKKEGKTLEKLREELRKTKDFPGVTGSLTFDARQCLQRPLFAMRVDANGRTLLKKFSP